MRDDKFYSEHGFKCGLEIHQRLATSEKLFCSCTARLADNRLTAKVERTQRAVAGELGAIDRSTSFESSRGRKFTYHLFRKSTCLVDIDEEPPHTVNASAVEMALKIASSLDCSVPDEIEPMRKEVVDGSDPSAFQRSMIVGYSGSIDVNGKKIGITSVFLEEESSGIESSSNDVVVYNVDRLGVPLIEIDTDPTISNPKEAKETALKIGLLLRLTGSAQRGIGSIRQDVNVSVKEGTRVEIKGLQELDMMDQLIENEVERQLKLIEIKDELAKRNASVGEPLDVTGLFKNSAAKIIRESISSGGVVLALKLNSFKGIVGYEINPDRRLGSEISDYAKMAGVGGIIHSDEKLESYGISGSEISALKEEIGTGENDAFIIIAAKSGICEKAMEAARQRAELLFVGVPPETRAANPQVPTTRFMRPLPGGSRMYPETDAVPIGIDPRKYKELAKERVDPNRIRQGLEKEIKNKQLSEQMLWSEELQLYNKITKTTKAAPSLIAAVLIEKFKEMRRNGINADQVDDSVMVYIFEKYADNTITKTGIEELIRSLPKSSRDVDRLVKEKKLKRLSTSELKKLIKESGEKKKEDVVRSIMSKYRMNIDGEELNKLVK